jgi:hypothetical protein
VNQPLWSAVDDYWTTKLHAPDDALDAATADSAADPGDRHAGRLLDDLARARPPE